MKIKIKRYTPFKGKLFITPKWYFYVRSTKDLEELWLFPFNILGRAWYILKGLRHRRKTK